MAKIIKTTCSYKAPNGQEVIVPFEYNTYESVQEAVAILGEAGIVTELNRMSKVDAGNGEREKAKVANGHSTRVKQTEEQKAEAKAKRLVEKDMLARLRAKGITSVEQLSQL